MNIEDAVHFAQSAIEKYTKKSLNDSQMAVLRGALEGKSYGVIAAESNFSYEYAKQIGSELCTTFSTALKLKVTKNNIITVIQQCLPTEKPKISDYTTLPISNDEVRDFVGRTTAITDINNLINQGRKIIVIQAAGGVGKTTLAKQYLTQFDLILPLEMAKDKENITAVESVVEDWMKQYFKEEPGREFGITIARLKLQLQNRKVGVLIDNLEPALDECGRLIEKHNGYVRLLNILADLTVQSITLITSRERLCDDRVNGIYHYPLAVLTVPAWREFFTSHQIQIDTSSLEAMHKIYGGNAKAMDILLGVIREDYQEDMAAYWQENCTLVETELKNLVESQFKRLQTLDNEAYKLLCRLGCFRYQDVPRVSIDALLALLWDVPEEKRRDVIKSLRNRCLVEFEKGEYWLHPVVRQQGIERLKVSREWEKVNRKAAEFWTESVKNIETINDAKEAFEPYYHYNNIQDYKNIGNIMFRQRRISSTYSWENFIGGINLFDDFRRLGLLGNCRPIQELQDKINLTVDEDLILLIYFTFGFCCINWWLGKIKLAIEQCKNTIDLIGEHQQKLNIYSRYEYDELYLGSLTTIGYCYLHLFNFNNAEEYFNQVLELTDKHHKNHYKFSFYIESSVALAFIQSCKNNPDVNAILKTLEDVFCPDIIEYQHLNFYCSAYRLLFASLAYKNIGIIEKAQEKLNKIFKKQNEPRSYIYKQVLGLAHSTQAELYRSQEKWENALSHHSESIEILDKIGDICDLAEAYYQLGLTYQKMGEIENSHINFNTAIQFYQEMEAPKQVEKVEKAKKGN
jgi:tetratricopeptide (TPR) repeat protein